MSQERFAEWVCNTFGPKAFRDLAFLAVLFAFVTVAYGPSLRHPPRADQWCYLADTVNDHTFRDTFRHTYSYNRTRLVAPGDTDLFRPVLFALLAAEKAALGGHFDYVQALGVGFHGAICVLLLVVLRQTAGLVRPPESKKEVGTSGSDWLMYGTVAFFALNPCVQELVIWGHLHGYLLFLLFLLGSISCVLRYAARGRAGKDVQWPLYGAWVLAALSAFTYELGQVYAVLAGLVLAAEAAPRVGKPQAFGTFAAFAAVLIGYQLANHIDQNVHQGQYQPENLHAAIVKEAATPATLTHSARYGVFTAVQPFFPSLVQTFYGGQRLQVLETVWTGSRLRVLTPTLAVSYATLLAGTVLGAAGLWRVGQSRARLICALPVALYAVYAAMNVLGRMNMRPHSWILSGNSYYTYFALLFALLAASAAWHATGAWAVNVRKGLAAGLVALAALGAEQVWQANTMVAREEREWTRALRAVQKFVDAHEDEPGFSFEIDYPSSDPVPVVHGERITRLVFAEWMSAPQPRYRIAIREGKAVPQPAPAQAAR
ncbi:hypothetical protein GobsT_56490 [Gemmata obscuriglobus]|uniref:DUF2723 domain-containing protein n=1 Tax=Gemmata obscuriglobus TaxID=114 RepID=A0A2Z3GQF8_9BACT|nr:hypothetical protein [Gemmata obscuriglobus]AWM36539.1 hypothetical protein C1280_05545 [Gemmata obscuriglobus]QEG30836.1 hypothetical protein GobsT_56490 [Gemmata obscuriglobus]VTS10167.1 unnamed protein product [Gemmata obscuriglobus UQM 2246]